MGPLAALLLAGCGGDAPTTAARDVPRVVADAPPDTLVSSASGLLGGVADVLVGEDGTVYLSDLQNQTIHRIRPGGEQLPPLGREGEGPGELRQPQALAVRGDTLVVVDAANERLQRFSIADGAFLESEPAAAPARFGAVPAPDGWVAYPTMGFRDSALVRLVAPDHTEMALGRIEGDPMEVVRMRTLKERIAAGEVPGFFLNHVGAAFAPDGDVWLAAPGRPSVSRWSRDGRRQWTLVLDEPGFDAVRADFVRLNAEAPPNRLFSLRYFVDASPVGDELWLLVAPEDGSSRIVVVGAEGRVVRRIDLPSIRGAGALAVDPFRRALYLVVPARAELLRVTLPGDALGRVG